LREWFTANLREETRICLVEGDKKARLFDESGFWEVMGEAETMGW